MALYKITGTSLKKSKRFKKRHLVIFCSKLKLIELFGKKGYFGKILLEDAKQNFHKTIIKINKDQLKFYLEVLEPTNINYYVRSLKNLLKIEKLNLKKDSIKR